MNKEVEVKFKIDNFDDIKTKLINLGASFGERYRQTTYGFFLMIL